MADVWKGYRIFLGSTMVLVFVCGAIIIDLSKSQVDLMRRVVEGGKYCGGIAQTVFDLWMGPVREPYLAARDLPRVRFNLSADLKWPVIPTVLDMKVYRPYPWPTSITEVFYSVGAGAIAVSLLGLYTAWNKGLGLTVGITFILVMFMLNQFLLIFSFTMEWSRYHMRHKNDLLEVLKSEYEVGAEVESDFSYYLNSVMVTWECCGVRGPADFLSQKYNFTWVYDRNDSSASDSSRDGGQSLEMPPRKEKVLVMGANETLSFSDDEEVENQTEQEVLLDRAKRDNFILSGGDHNLTLPLRGEVSEMDREGGEEEKEINWILQDDPIVSSTREVLFPLACCRKEIHMKGFQATLQCATSGDIKLINNVGCYSKVHRHLFRDKRHAIMNTFFYLMLIEMVLLIMITILANEPRGYEKDAANAAIYYSEHIQSLTDLAIEKAEKDRITAMEEAEQKKKERREAKLAKGPPEALQRTSSGVDDPSMDGKPPRRFVFVPYAKVSSSSSVSKDGHRSTEIW